MIFVSSTSVRTQTIKEAVEFLAENEFRNIELSGGSKFYPDYEKDLLKLQSHYDLNYIVHNYFPPPQEDFVLNLASLKDDIFERSVRQIESAIALSRSLGAKKYGFHAGFFFDLDVREIGKQISLSDLNPRQAALLRFRDGFNRISETASDDVQLYLENNVLSMANSETFAGRNPFMLTDFSGFQELQDLGIAFKLLLDVAHLNVSCHSLGLDFSKEIAALLPLSDYIHISDNDGVQDSNQGLKKNSNLFDILKTHDFSGATITLEINEDIDIIQRSYEIVENELLAKGAA